MIAVWLTAACQSPAAGHKPDKPDKPAESCQMAGDEDSNGLADCADPACAGTPACRPACGNGKIETGEACDDGNTLDGDGCDHSCKIEVLVYLKAAHADAGDLFGMSIAVSADGSTLAIGAPGEDSAAKGINGDQTDDSALDAGAVYVFTRSGAAWQPQAYVKASNTSTGYLFGWSVALSADGSILAVGSPGEASAVKGGEDPDNTEAPHAGAAYVFTRTGAAWSQQAYVKTTNPDEGDQLGDSIALSADGSTLAVGADYEDSAARGIDGDPTNNAAEDAGAVYVFTRSGATWNQDTYVKASNPGARDQFGKSLSLSGDGATLAVGAFLEDSAATGVGGDQRDDSAEDAGAVYVFARGATWSQAAYLKASNTDAGDMFGMAVTLSADGATLAVGAPNESAGIADDQADDAAPGAGAVYVFSHSDAAWRQEAYIKASNTDAGDAFGISVALSADGSGLAVGSPFEDSAATGVAGNQADNTAESAGAAYGFTRSGKTWRQVMYAKASNTEAGDMFGFSAALSGDAATLAVGAIGEGGSLTDPLMFGAVYVYQ